MPTEEEELRLTVSLVDNASAGIAKLREEMQSLGSGSTAQGLEKFKREQASLKESAKGLEGTITELVGGFGTLGKTMVGAVGYTAAFGLEVARQISGLKEWAAGLREISLVSQALGVGGGHLRNVIEQFKIAGISAETTVANVGKMSAAIADLQREGSKLKFDILKDAGAAGGGAARAMESLLDKLSKAKDIEEQYNIVRQAGDQIYRNRIALGDSEQKAAAVRNEFYKNFWDHSINAVDQLTTKSKEWYEAEERRLRLGKEFDKQLNTFEGTWSRIGDIISTLKVGPLTNVMENINSISTSILRTFESLEQLLIRIGNTEVWKRLGVPGTLEGKMEPLPRKPSDTESWLDKWNEYWAPRKQQMSFSGGGVGADNPLVQQAAFQSIVQQAAFTPGGGLGRTPGGAPMFGGGGDAWGGGAVPGGGAADYSGAGGVVGGGAFGYSGGAQGGAGAFPSVASRPDASGATPNGSTVGPGQSAAGNVASGNGEVGPAAALAFARQHLNEDEIRDQTKLSGFFREQGIKINPATTAWCAAFVNANLAKAGIKGTSSLAAGSFTNYGKGITADEVQAGDIGVVRGRSPRTGVEGSHVGFLTGNRRVNPKTGAVELEMLGGNQGGTASGKGGVSTHWRSASSLHLRRAPMPNGQTAGPGSGKGAGDTPAHADGAQAGGGGGLTPNPYDPSNKSIPASIRNANVGASWPRAADLKYGGSVGVLGDPSNKIGKFTTVEGGMAANMELLSQKYQGMTVSSAISKWSGSHRSSVPGFASGEIVTADILNNPEKRRAWFHVLAKAEAGKDWVTDEQIDRAYEMYQAGGMKQYLAQRGGVAPTAADAGVAGAKTAFRSGGGYSVLAEDRQQIDKSQAATTTVNGTGKITVDVNAPKGTKVGAEGGGLFKDVEVNRQTQMEPARRSAQVADEPMNI
ncbi:hypothetical protein I6F35_02725 [Bradyrhizobium sp. BRP22]|uniref:hypothetical protein n=1 Tax=Bradyrhizobium sp. BRP22 TaxID=2793821 RepID=UPI001CD3C8EB|nr:hypothetical protein [Bradyrhizobium sp. BRP22]MCA1452128.1 hypothetical protein [Bradyrhizobium sp. BRP22]